MALVGRKVGKNPKSYIPDANNSNTNTSTSTVLFHEEDASNEIPTGGMSKEP